MRRLFITFVWLCLFAAGTTGCQVGLKKSEPLTANFFAGEFVCIGDAAVFYDCLTGVHYPVAAEADYPAAEKGYMALGPEPGERVGVNFRGHLEYLPSTEQGAGRVRTMVIDALIGFDRSGSCNWSYVVAGVYQSDNKGIRNILRLRPDYTFTEASYAADGTETLREGSWGAVSREEVALDYSGGELAQALFQIVPDQESLVRNDRKGVETYKKVYLN